jgi:hypothetical protein
MHIYACPETIYLDIPSIYPSACVAWTQGQG